MLSSPWIPVPYPLDPMVLGAVSGADLRIEFKPSLTRTRTAQDREPKFRSLMNCQAPSNSGPVI